ncbi:hypothetical protein GCM10022226_46770 [Sphaerisporangium flaviroseum]|uniref:Uncharacterized protein n=1 Tax=Sphaerisporangium flaviroseum TaxID=509199 RepID=A0ABP7IL69_9ACTN
MCPGAIDEGLRLRGEGRFLKLRALIANGDFPTYWRYRLDHEHHARYQDDYDLSA